MKNTICPGASDLEFQLCITEARHRRLDPIKKQIWFVPRWNSQAENADGTKGRKVWVPQVSIDGLRHIAARDHRDYGNEDEVEYGPMKEVKWTYTYQGKLKEKSIQAPEWARVSIWKKGATRPTVATVWWDEVYPDISTSPLVQRMPRLMLGKCASAQANRRAYPETGGLYIPEEFYGGRAEFTADGRHLVYPEDGVPVSRAIEAEVERQQRGELPSNVDAFPNASNRGIISKCQDHASSAPRKSVKIEGEEGSAPMLAARQANGHTASVAQNTSVSGLERSEQSENCSPAMTSSKEDTACLEQSPQTRHATSSSTKTGVQSKSRLPQDTELEAESTTTRKNTGLGSTTSQSSSTQKLSTNQNYPNKPLGIVTIDYTDEAWPIVRGDLANILDALHEALPAPMMDWGKDSWWHVQPRAIETLKAVLEKLHYQCQEVFPSSAATPAGRPCPPAGPPTAQGKERKAPTPSAPAVDLPPMGEPGWVTGIIEQANPESGKNPRVSVLFKIGKAASFWMSTFDKKLFAPLMAGKKQEATLVIERRKTGDKLYTNIIGLRRVGKTEYDEDGCTPVVQNNTREAGGKTLFP